MAFLMLLIPALITGTDPAKENYEEYGVRWIEAGNQQGQGIHPVDSLVLVETAGDFGLYLDETYGTKKTRKVFDKTETPEQFTDALNRITGLRFGSHYYDFYNWQEENTEYEEIWRETESDHFIYLYRSGSQAAQDIHVIKDVAEKAYEDLVTIIKPDSTRLARLQKIVRGDAGAQSWSGKIVIRIQPTRKDIAGSDRILGGQTLFKPVELEDQVGYFLEIRLSYPGSAGLFGLPHEMAHALVNLFLTDEPALSEMFSSSIYVTSNRIQSALPAQEFLRSEGFAYMFQYNYSSYVRLGLWRPSQGMLINMQKLYGEIEIDELMSGQVDETFTEEILSLVGLKGTVKQRQLIKYQIASADLMRFLYQEYGSEKLRLFLASREEPRKAIEDVYGSSADQLENQWLGSLKE